MKVSELCLTKKGNYSRICLHRNLAQLRKEITLNSLYISDYENSFDIDAHECSDFFDGFISYCTELEIEKYGHELPIEEFFAEFDTLENLIDWYLCIDFGE